MDNWGLSIIRIADLPSKHEIVAIFPHSLQTKNGAEDKTRYCRPTTLVLTTLLQWVSAGQLKTAIAVDVPFGWPSLHREFLNSFSAKTGLVQSRQMPSRMNFERRLCDITISTKFKDRRVAPLSVSADTLGQAAFRWAEEREALQPILGCIDVGLPLDCDQSVHCFETYPAAFVRCCFPSQASYKSAKEIPARRALLAELFQAYRVLPTANSEVWCERAINQSGSPDALDSLLCAFCAWDYLELRSNKPSIVMSTPEKILGRPLTADDISRVETEGWILFRYEAFGIDPA